MAIRESLSELRGTLAITREEGANLGGIARIHVEPDTRSICCITLRTGRDGRRVIRAEHLVGLGRDVVFVDSEASLESITPPGRSLRTLQGMWVTTIDGKHLGHLVDVDVRGESMELCELRLVEGTELAVEPQDIVIGQDEIIVPSDYAERVVTSEQRTEGFLERIFGSEPIEEARGAIRRAFRRGARGESEEPKIEREP